MAPRFLTLLFAVIAVAVVLALGSRPDSDTTESTTGGQVLASNQSASTVGDTADVQTEVSTSSTNESVDGPDIETESSVQQRPKLLSKVPAVFPTQAIQQNLTDGSVVLGFTVTDRGTVKDIFVMESDGEVFEDAAIAAVSEYLYEPAIENGVPVETTGVSEYVSFNVAGPRTTPQINRDGSGRLSSNVIFGRETNSSGATPLQADDDGAQIQLTRVLPRFPDSAAEAGIESGYVMLSFTVTETGEAANIAVIESTSDHFDAPAIEAIDRGRYMPRMENGRPVAREGVKQRVDFSAP